MLALCVPGLPSLRSGYDDRESRTKSKKCPVAVSSYRAMISTFDAVALCLVGKLSVNKHRKRTDNGFEQVVFRLLLAG